MRIVLSTVTALSLICVLASCARGGNADKGNGGYIGTDQSNDDVIVTTVDDNIDDSKINGYDVNINRSNDGISGRKSRGLNGYNPDTLIPEGIRR